MTVSAVIVKGAVKVIVNGFTPQLNVIVPPAGALLIWLRSPVSVQLVTTPLAACTFFSKSPPKAIPQNNAATKKNSPPTSGLNLEILEILLLCVIINLL
jgi:hypothetical protein